MATTIAIRFPLGRYHANPWDRSVNEGAAEWPPSPWRLLRALVATWYTRWPDLPAEVLEGLLDALGDPPSYRTPRVRPAHTRHYLPDLDHKKGETGGTDLTLDPFLSLRPDEELLVRWDADLDQDQRAALAKLVELLPYIGRAESVCAARLLDEDPEPDEKWWRPGASGSRRSRLLAPTRPISRQVIELSTLDVRRSRRTVPPGTMWVSYSADAEDEQPPGPRHHEPCVEAVRFFITGPAPLRATHGILLADEVHRKAGNLLAAAEIDEARRQALFATKGAGTHHQHAHWIPIADGTGPDSHVPYLVVWVPNGLQPDEIAALINVRDASGRRGGNDSEAYEIRGFPPVRLLFQAAGPIGQVGPELCGPARRWRSMTPYLPVRHRKRESLDDFAAADVATELGYRGWPSAKVSRLAPEDGLPDRWSLRYRRYRIKETLGRARPGLGLRLEFDDEVQGPLLLGQLSHFGYGIFVPDQE